MKLALLNGSPRGAKATSLIFLNEIIDHLNAYTSRNNGELRTEIISVETKGAGKTPPDRLKPIAEADAVVISFPLYTYTIPAAMMKFLEDYYQHLPGAASADTAGPKFYAVVNCAFPVPSINREALRVMKCFAFRCGMQWRFGIGIGGGPVVAMMKNIPLVNRKLRRSFERIIYDIFDESEVPLQNIFIKPFIPKAVMLHMKDSKWAKKYMAKQID